MTPYNRFQNEISKEKDERRPIKLRQGGLRYLITKNRLNYLMESYRPLFFDKNYISFPYRDKDFPTWLVVLRYHFKLWVEFDDSSSFLKVYKNFPNEFILTKEVNKDNHWFAEETIPDGTILFLAKDNYGMVNWLNGIPLSKIRSTDIEPNDIPITQINYGYIKPFKTC